MGRLWKMVLICLLCTMFVQGCTSSHQTPQKTTLAEIYPGDLTKVNRVELMDATSGERKWLSDPVDIRLWINGMKDIVLIPAENQEGAVGSLYVIGFYEGEEQKLWFTPSSIADVYYETNPIFTGQIQLRFEREFGALQSEAK